MAQFESELIRKIVATKIVCPPALSNRPQMEKRPAKANVAGELPIESAFKIL
jgi:hypothetical protein